MFADYIVTCIARWFADVPAYRIRGGHRGILVSPTLVTGRALGDGHVFKVDHEWPEGSPETALLSITVLLPEHD